MLRPDLSDDAEPNAHPTLGGGPTKRVSGVGLDTQGLERNDKIPKSIVRVGAQPPVEQRRCQSKGFDCTCTHYDDANDRMVAA